MNCLACYYFFTTQNAGGDQKHYWCDCPDTQIDEQPREMTLTEAFDHPEWCAVTKLETGTVCGPATKPTNNQ